MKGRGFTLLEVMVAGALFLIGTSAVLSAWRSVTSLMELQRRSADAVAVADDTLDDLRLRQRDSADLNVGNHVRFFDVARRPVPAAVVDGYTVQWVVEDSQGLTFRRLDVTVLWQGFDRRPHQIVFATFRPSA